MGGESESGSLFRVENRGTSVERLGLKSLPVQEGRSAFICHLPLAQSQVPKLLPNTVQFCIRPSHLFIGPDLGCLQLSNPCKHRLGHFWEAPNLLITPQHAAVSFPNRVVEIVAADYRRFAAERSIQ